MSKELLEFGGYFQLSGLGGSIGLSSDEGLVLTGFTQASAVVAGAVSFGISFNLLDVFNGDPDDGIFNTHSGLYIGIATPTNTPGIAASAKREVNTGAGYASVGVGLTDVGEGGFYVQGIVNPTPSARAIRTFDVLSSGQVIDRTTIVHGDPPIDGVRVEYLHSTVIIRDASGRVVERYQSVIPVTDAYRVIEQLRSAYADGPANLGAAFEQLRNLNQAPTSSGGLLGGESVSRNNFVAGQAEYLQSSSGFFGGLFSPSIGGFHIPGDKYLDFRANGSIVTFDYPGWVAHTVEGLGGWTPPSGTRIEPLGGGFKIVNDDGSPWEPGTPTDYSLDSAYDEDGEGTRDGRGYGGNDKNSPSKEEWEDLFENSFGEGWRDGDGGKPIILDLDGDGIQVTELSQSTTFMDADNSGLLHRTAWAAAGDGVLFFDANDDGAITETREYVFTEWDATATSDLDALRSVFDSNGDGKLTAADDAWASFEVMVTQPDGSQVAMSLDQLGITEIDLTGDATHIELPDGSVITGQTTFTRADGRTGTVADMILQAEAQGCRLEQVESTDGSGNRVVEITGYHAIGEIAFAETSVTSPDGSSITNSYDDNGDGVVDRVQTIVTVANPDGSETKTVENYVGAQGIIFQNRTATTTSSDGTTITIARDTMGGGWPDQVETRVTHADESLTITITDQSQGGTAIRSIVKTVSADGLTRSDAIDENADGTIDLTVNHAITVHPDGSRTEAITTLNQDGSLRDAVSEQVSIDGQARTISRDLDGDGQYDDIRVSDIMTSASGSSSTISVKNGDGSLRSSTTETLSADALSRTSEAPRCLGYPNGKRGRKTVEQKPAMRCCCIGRSGEHLFAFATPRGRDRMYGLTSI